MRAWLKYCIRTPLAGSRSWSLIGQKVASPP
jgi:hypothetical protein